jgi:SOS-response transcriptional repressor LexA
MTARGETTERVYDVITQHFLDYGHAPTVRQVMAATGLASTSAAHYHIHRLVKAERLYICKCGCGRANSGHRSESLERYV